MNHWTVCHESQRLKSEHKDAVGLLVVSSSVPPAGKASEAAEGIMSGREKLAAFKCL